MLYRASVGGLRSLHVTSIPQQLPKRSSHMTSSFRVRLVGAQRGKSCLDAHVMRFAHNRKGKRVVQDQKFGPFTINDREQFAQSELSFAFVNLKPIVKGHTLISPRRVVPRFTELEAGEVADLWRLAQRVGKVLEKRLGASGLTLAIQEDKLRRATRVAILSFEIYCQDGAAAGQSVPHVHVHCLPRREGDFQRNDDIYDALDSPEFGQQARGEKLDMDAERPPRSPEALAEEAAEFRAWFEETQ